MTRFHLKYIDKPGGTSKVCKEENVFLLYSTTLPVSQITKRRMGECLVNQMERIWKEAALIRKFSGGPEGNHEL
jgi:hypothetical protein